MFGILIDVIVIVCKVVALLLLGGRLWGMVSCAVGKDGQEREGLGQQVGRGGELTAASCAAKIKTSAAPF